MSFLRISFVFFLVIPFTIKAQPDTISLDNFHLSLDKVDNVRKLGVVVWDQRELIVEGSEKGLFLGYAKTVAYVNTDPVTIKGELPLAEWLSDRISKAYNDSGLATMAVGVTANEATRAQVELKMKSANVDRILVLQIKKLHFDNMFNWSYMAKFEIEVYSENIELLKAFPISEERDMERTDDWKMKFPLELISIVEDALNNTEVLKALSE